MNFILFYIFYYYLLAHCLMDTTIWKNTTPSFLHAKSVWNPVNCSRLTYVITFSQLSWNSKHSILLRVNNVGRGVELNADNSSSVASVVSLLRGLKWKRLTSCEARGGQRSVRVNQEPNLSIWSAAHECVHWRRGDADNNVRTTHAPVTPFQKSMKQLSSTTPPSTYKKALKENTPK
jgi:hypothetical protein